MSLVPQTGVGDNADRETRHFAACSHRAMATLRPAGVQVGSFILFLLPAGSPSLLVPSETGGKKQEGVLNRSEGHFDESDFTAVK